MPKKEPVPAKEEIIISTQTDLCANCGALVKDAFCGHCGQHVIEIKRPFWKLVAGFLGEAFSLDNKFFDTFKPLVWRPWVLTQDFMNGRRIRYTPPFRMYLFSAFIAFLLLATNYALYQDEFEMVDTSESAYVPTTTITILGSKTEGEQVYSIGGMLTLLSKGIAKYIEDNDLKQKGGGEYERWQEGVRVLERGGILWEANPKLMMDAFLKKLSTLFLFVFIAFALLLALLYYSKQRYFIEHLLLSLHFHSFIFIVLSLVTLFLLPSVDLLSYIGITFLLFVPVQLFRMLRNYYKQSYFVTSIKYVVLLVSYASFILFSVVYAFFESM